MTDAVEIKEKPPRKKRNREDYVPQIIDWIADGGTLSDICDKLEIPFGTASMWFVDNGKNDLETVQRYRRAREIGAAKHVDKMLALTERAMTDKDINPQILKIHTDNIKWYAARLYRSVYGDKPENPTNTTNNTLNLTVDNREAARNVLAMLSSAGTIEHEPDE